MKEVLNIVDETGRIVGEASRKEIHQKGLLHREIHVWFVTSDGQVIFQRRSSSKDTFPNLLDTSVGGHVDLGMDFIDSALKETAEETGVRVKASDLVLLSQTHITYHDDVTGTINNALQRNYVFAYRGKVEDLRVEAADGLGFEAWPVERLQRLSDQEREVFVPTTVDEALAAYAVYVSSELSRLVDRREFRAAYNMALEELNRLEGEWSEARRQVYHLGAIAASFMGQYDQARDWWEMCYSHATDDLAREDVRRDIALSDIRSGNKERAKESVQALLNHPSSDANRGAIRHMVQGNLARLLGNLVEADGFYDQGIVAFDSIDTDEVNKQWTRNTAYRGLLNTVMLGGEAGVPRREVAAYGERALQYGGEVDPSPRRNEFVRAILRAYDQGGYVVARREVEAQENMI